MKAWNTALVRTVLVFECLYFSSISCLWCFNAFSMEINRLCMECFLLLININ